MKTSLLSLLACTIMLATTSNVEAQIGIGVRGGILSSGATINDIENGNEDEVDTDNITGFLIGIPVEIAVSNVFSLQPEINYLRRGYNIPADLDNGISENQSTYNVLEIPVLAKLGYTTENYTLAAVFGPAYQRILGGQIETQDITVAGQTIQGSKVDIDFDDQFFDDLDRDNFYGQAGLQIGIPIGFGKFMIDGRYRFAFNDENSNDNREIRSRGLSATAGIMVTLGDY